MLNPLSLLAAVLLLACLFSFGWAMKRFFTQPSGSSPGMQLIKLSGVGFSVLHLWLLLFTPGDVVPTAVGIAVYLASLGLFWWTLRTHRQAALSAAFSNDRPRHLVTAGPYRFVRHPFYSSYLLCWSAGAVITADWLLIGSALFMGGVYLIASAIEEHKFADSDLASAYRVYCSRTGRFLPNPLKMLNAAQGRLSVGNVSASEE